MNSTASSLVPPTQNTAPVIKFRCLFTHDLRRKAKRWQDGFLRFHTFNRRVMVYDVPGNFIGDLHWRESEELNDGDELELERGVLVQVGECVEKSQTDLTELLDKRKHGAGSSPAKAFSPGTNRPGTAFSTPAPASSGHIKSLNEVLGIRRTPIGRTAALDRSPYERRHQIAADPVPTTVERPPKRQKTVASAQERDVDVPARHGPLRDTNSYATASNSTSPFQSAGGLPRNRSKISKSSKPILTTAAEQGKGTKTQPLIDLSNSNGVANTLRIATEKPRKKLMYKDLLPQSRPSTKPPDGTRNAKNMKPRDKQPSILIEDSDSETENIPPPIPAFKSATLASTDISSTLHFVPSSSMLHALEEAAPPSPPQQKNKNLHQFFKPSGQKPPPRLREEREPTPPVQDPVLEPITEPPPLNPPANKPVSLHRPLARSHSDIPRTIGVNNAFPPPPPPPPPANKPISSPRPLSRSHSDIAVTSRVDTAPQPHPQPLPIQNETDTSPQPANAKLPPAKPLQKSLSDTSSLHTISAAPVPRTRQSLLAPKRNQHVATCVDVDEEDQGPWTEEALDLFDWWPPGRPKPEGRRGVAVGQG
ncbi:hypothetical protein FQN51_002990 [Onygenales sp. PD_10]|nr:hypothetical protein FQN51_002990 [Onygenales sp. PD_10]